MSDTMEYKCPACGGALEFDSALQKMKCPYCDSVFEMAELQAMDSALDGTQDWKKPENEWDGEADGISVFVCQSCGGEIVCDENTAATSCPYCGNPVVMTGRVSGELKPDYVIPFKLDKEAAKEKYRQYISGKFLLPKAFRDENHIDEIKGIYVPFWLFDSDVQASAGYIGENVRSWVTGGMKYTETSYYDVFREGRMSFRNIPVDGSTKMDDALMESLEPFDFSEAVPFQSAYLAGYFADKYDVDIQSSEPRANARILKSARTLLDDSASENYTAIKSSADSSFSGLFDELFKDSEASSQHGCQIDVRDGKVKYALYPVWFLNTTYKDKKFIFAMNGQTGRMVGELPIDKGRKNGLFAGVCAGVSVVSTILLYLLFG